MQLKTQAQINFRTGEETICESLEVKKLGYTHEAIYQKGLETIFKDLKKGGGRCLILKKK